jgi:hypothetical protein
MDPEQGFFLRKYSTGTVLKKFQWKNTQYFLKIYLCIMLLFRSLGFLVWANFSFTGPGFVFGPISAILSGSNSIRTQLHKCQYILRCNVLSTSFWYLD